MHTEKPADQPAHGKEASRIVGLKSICVKRSVKHRSAALCSRCTHVMANARAHLPESGQSAHDPDRFFVHPPRSRAPRIFHSLTTLLLFLMAIACLRHELFAHFATHYLGGYEGDPGLYIWLIEVTIRDLLHAPWFSTPAFYPYGASLAWSDNFILPALFCAGLRALGIPPIPSYNLMLLAAMLLNGWCVYRLALTLGAREWGARTAGFAVLSFSALAFNLGHPQLQFLFWVALGLERLFIYWRNPRFLNAVLIGLCVDGAFLSAIYYALFLALALVVSAVVLMLTERRWSFFVVMTKLGPGLFTAAVPLIPFVTPYLAVRDVFGPRAIFESFYFGATARSYLSAAPGSRFLQWTTAWSHDEAHLGIGLTSAVILIGALFAGIRERAIRAPLLSLAAVLALLLVLGFRDQTALVRSISAASLWVLLLAGLWLARRCGRTNSASTSISTSTSCPGYSAAWATISVSAIVFFSLSYGPLARPDRHETLLSPFAAIYHLMPGFSSLRAISRAGIVVYMFLALLLARALSGNLGRTLERLHLAWLPGLLLVVEGLPLFLPLQPPTPTPTAIQAFLEESRVTADQAPSTSSMRSAVIVLPLAAVDNNRTVREWSQFARFNTNYMNWLFAGLRPTLNGYSGQRSKIMLEMPGQTADFPDTRSQYALCQVYGLGEIILLGGAIPQFNEAELYRRLDRPAAAFELLAAFPDRSYRLKPRCHLQIAKSFDLLLPAAGEKRVRIELRPAQQPEKADMKSSEDRGQAAVVEAVLRDDEHESELARVTLMPNAQWSLLSLLIPSGRETVRPLRLRFRSAAERPFEIRFATPPLP